MGAQELFFYLYDPSYNLKWKQINAALARLVGADCQAQRSDVRTRRHSHTHSHNIRESTEVFLNLLMCFTQSALHHFR